MTVVAGGSSPIALVPHLNIITAPLSSSGGIGDRERGSDAGYLGLAGLWARPNVDPRVLYETHEYLWATGEKTRALNGLSEFLLTLSSPAACTPATSREGSAYGCFPSTIDRLSQLIPSSNSMPTQLSFRNSGTFPMNSLNSSGVPGITGLNTTGVNKVDDAIQDSQRAFRVQCLLKRAEWMRELSSPLTDVLATVMEARELEPDLYSVWHAWAVTNYDQVDYHRILKLRI